MSNDLNLNKHISSTFNDELENIRQLVLSMGGAVEQQLKNALQSLIKGDVELAENVISGDKEINGRELEIDRLCMETIALRQPIASDLRLLLCVIKTISELERIGDLSYKLAMLGKKLTDKGYSMRYYSELESVGDKVTSMLSASLDAFARSDADAAIQAMEIELEIDIESVNLARKIVSYMLEEPAEVKKTLRLGNANSTLERIGDHCENICENVIYLVKGEDVRYQNFDEVKRKILREEEDE